MSTEHAMRETVEALQARFEKDAMAYHDRYLRFTDWHWKKKAEDAKKWRDVFSQLNEQCKAALERPIDSNEKAMHGSATEMHEALNRVLIILRSIIGAGESDAKLIRDCERHIRAALAAPDSDQEPQERPIDSNEKTMHSSATEMHEACRAMNDDGDPTLCEKLKCPHYGEPNGCNSPTGEYPSVGSAVEMYEALKAIAEICDGGDTGGLPERMAIYNIAKAALSTPAKNRELYATCSDTADVQRDALRKIKGLFRDIDLTIDCPENEAYAIADKALSVPPRTGKWKNGREYEYEYAYCSACGRMQWAGWDSHKEAEENIESFADNYRFCPGCGARMEGGVYVK